MTAKLTGPKVPHTYTLLVPIERLKNGVVDSQITEVTIKRRPRFRDAKKIGRVQDNFDRLAMTLKLISDMTLDSVIDELDIADVNALNELVGPFFSTSDDESSSDEDSSDESSSGTNDDASDT